MGDYPTVRDPAEEVIAVFDGFGGGMMGANSNLLLPSIDVAIALYHAYRRAP